MHAYCMYFLRCLLYLAMLTNFPLFFDQYPSDGSFLEMDHPIGKVEQGERVSFDANRL